jgi:large subunit ribosomal protein L30
MAKIRVKQIRSAINKPIDQKKTVKALGLRKLNQVVEHEATPQILGMIQKVKHLIEVEEIK